MRVRFRLLPGSVPAFYKGLSVSYAPSFPHTSIWVSAGNGEG